MADLKQASYEAFNFAIKKTVFSLFKMGAGLGCFPGAIFFSVKYLNTYYLLSKVMLCTNREICH